MELKFRDVGSEYIETQCGVKVRPYYTIEELNTIIEDMKNKDTSLAKHFAKVLLTTEFCTNLKIEDMKNTDIYNLVASLGLIADEFKSIQMYDEIDDMIKDDKDIYDLIKGVTDSLEKSISGVNSPEAIAQQVESMKGMIVNANKESNATSN